MIEVFARQHNAPPLASQNRTATDICRRRRRRMAGCWRSQFYIEMARPKRFELLTPRFVVWCSIQLSYGRAARLAAGVGEIAEAAARCNPLEQSVARSKRACRLRSARPDGLGRELLQLPHHGLAHHAGADSGSPGLHDIGGPEAAGQH